MKNSCYGAYFWKCSRKKSCNFINIWAHHRHFAKIEPTISDKNYWDSLYFYKKIPKKSWKMLDLFKGNYNFPSPLVKCCVKFEKAMSGSVGHEWPSKLANNIEKGAGGASLTNFVTDCRCKNTFFGAALIKCFGMLSRWVNTKKWNKSCFRGRLITRSTFCDTKIFF